MLRTIRFILIAGCGAWCLTACHDQVASSALSQRAYVWQREWTPAVSEALSRRRLFSAVAAVAGVSALGVAGAPQANASGLHPTAVSIRKVTQYRALTYTYNAKTKVTKVTKSTKVLVTARFSGSTVSLRNSKGTWVQIPYVWSSASKALVYSRALDLVLIARRKAATAPPPVTTAKSGSKITTPTAFATGSAYLTADWKGHLLRRAGYGPTPAALADVTSQGYAGWLESQLNPATLPSRLRFKLPLAAPSQLLNSRGEPLSGSIIV